MRTDWPRLVARALINTNHSSDGSLVARQVGESLHVTLRREDGSRSSAVLRFKQTVDVAAKLDHLRIHVDGGPATTVGTLRRQAVRADRWRRVLDTLCFWRR